jgi:predicted nucleotidyltransferase
MNYTREQDIEAIVKCLKKAKSSSRHNLIKRLMKKYSFSQQISLIFKAFDIFDQKMDLNQKR